MDELDRAREDLRTIARIGRDAQRGNIRRDTAIADMVRIASRDRGDRFAPPSRRRQAPAPSPADPPTGEEVLSEPAIREDLGRRDPAPGRVPMPGGLP